MNSNKADACFVFFVKILTAYLQNCKIRFYCRTNISRVFGALTVISYIDDYRLIFSFLKSGILS